MDPNTDVSAIPSNKKKYILFSLHIYLKVKAKDGREFARELQVPFVDMMRHFGPGALLASLVSGLPDETFVQMSDPKEFELLKRKGVCPYEYLKGLDKLKETKLPPMEAFGSELGCWVIYERDELSEIEPEQIEKEDYEYAKKVFTELGCKNLEDYTTHYCKTDTLLLADVFEAYRDESMRAYGIDLSYATSPSTSIDAML